MEVPSFRRSRCWLATIESAPLRSPLHASIPSLLEVPQVQLDLFPHTLSRADPTDADLAALIGIEEGDVPNGNTLDRLDRLGEFGWVAQDASGTLHLTSTGMELLRERMT